MAQPSRSVSLPIPLYFQPEDKAYCGPTAARMILAYFGIRKSLRAIVSGMPVSKRHGMFHTALGEYFLELGFSVTIKLFDPEFRCDFLYLGEPDVNKVIRRWCAKKPNNRFRASLRYFIDAGGVLIRVYFDHSITKNVLRCDVFDTGIGISQEQINRLFHAFDQADGSVARQFGGTGLGLAISRQLIELMGGEIGLISAPGNGSTARLSQPKGRCGAEIRIRETSARFPAFSVSTFAN